MEIFLFFFILFFLFVFYHLYASTQRVGARAFSEAYTKKEKFNIVTNSNHKNDTQKRNKKNKIKKMNEVITIPTEQQKIENYMNNFMEFNNRINHMSNVRDPVDNMNTSNNAQDYPLGTQISTIYDTLVNSNEYK